MFILPGSQYLRQWWQQNLCDGIRCSEQIQPQARTTSRSSR